MIKIGDVFGNKLLNSMVNKNFEYLEDSSKDLDIARGVYGNDL